MSERATKEIRKCYQSVSRVTVWWRLGAERTGGKETHQTGKLIKDDFESKIYSKCANEHLYIPCTETQPKYEEQHTSFAISTGSLAPGCGGVVFLLII